MYINGDIHIYNTKVVQNGIKENKTQKMDFYRPIYRHMKDARNPYPEPLKIQ